MMVIGRAMTSTEKNIRMVAMSLPATDVGAISPYPTVSTVTTHHQHVAGMDENAESFQPHTNTQHRGSKTGGSQNVARLQTGVVGEGNEGNSTMANLPNFPEFPPSSRIQNRK